MRPVCVKCQCEMRPKQNDVGVLTMAGDQPYQLWSADLWACPGCEVEIISGFGWKAMVEHWEDNFTHHLEDYKGRLYHNYEKPHKGVQP